MVPPACAERKEKMERKRKKAPINNDAIETMMAK